MAKKSNSAPQNGTLARIARTEAYAEKVRAMFAATVNRILELNKSLPHIEDGEMFSFDAQSEKMRAEVERALRQLHSVATTAIQQGIRLEWETANAECDKLVQSVFGKKVLNNPEFGAWTKRNNAAMRAFIARSESGLNLSQRVWQSTRQLRDEMEIAITVAVGDGTSAATLSRNVRKYLNDPDLMFRRFRYKDPETGEWRLKWKKRVIDPETGKVRFIDYDKDSYQDQWTGRGYYKSSAQNAMRVARTETNIAYRRADHERWGQMDFVIGQRVQMSRNHPKKDICDKLAGDYPKDFVFDGWHPQCFCFVTPILIDEDEYAEIMSHDNWKEELRQLADKHQITDYPDTFKSWVSDNADNIAAARERGTEPYFIRNNAGVIDNILNPDSTTPIKPELKSESNIATQPTQPAVQPKPTIIDVESIDKNIVPEMQYTSTPPRTMTWGERVDNAIRSAIYYEGNDCDVAKWYSGQIGSITDKTRAQYVIKRINEQIGKYSVVELPSIEHLMSLRTADVSTIHPAWRSRYNEIVKKLNAHDYTTGVKSIVREIEEAHNILQLSNNPNAVKFGLDKLSHRTPYQIFDAFEKKIPGFSASCPPKEFFDAFPEYVPLFTSGSGAYFLPSRKHVVIALNDSDNIERLTNSVWYRKGLFTHEYGHAFDYITGQRNDPTLIKIYDDWKTAIRKDKGAALEKSIVDALKPHRDAFDSWWNASEAKRKADEAVTNAKTWKDKKKAMDDRTKIRRAEYSKQLCDIEEQIGALSDCLGAALNGNRFITPRGHSGSYFAFVDKQIAEFIAHCSENYWSGNAYFKALAPQLYESMRKYIESKLKKP